MYSDLQNRNMLASEPVPGTPPLCFLLHCSPSSCSASPTLASLLLLKNIRCPPQGLCTTSSLGGGVLHHMPYWLTSSCLSRLHSNVTFAMTPTWIPHKTATFSSTFTTLILFYFSIVLFILQLKVKKYYLGLYFCVSYIL